MVNTRSEIAVLKLAIDAFKELDARLRNRYEAMFDFTNHKQVNYFIAGQCSKELYLEIIYKTEIFDKVLPIPNGT